MKKIPLFYPYVSDKARRSVMDTLKTKWIGQGPKVDEFEKALEEKFRRNYAVCVNSGTAALELAYELVGIKEGDEVVTTPLTCTATNIPLLRRGAKLVWADIDPDTLNMSKASENEKITDKTKAVVGVNLGGIQHELAKINNIPLITDSAQGIGLKNGDYVIYSFQAIKHFTTGDGGVLFCPDEETYQRARKLRWFGIDRDKKRAYDWQAYKEREMTFNIEEPGYKWHMNDIAASMGIEGLKDYDAILDHRRMIFDLYKNELDGMDGIKIVDGKNNVYWLATLLVDRRDDFVKKMDAAGIETNLVHVRNDIFNVFGGDRYYLPNLDSIEDKYISIPLNTMVSINDAHYIIKQIRSGW